MKPTITLLMPTLNEEEGLKLMLPRIDRTLFDEIVIVDGHSTDGTVKYAKENGIKVVMQKRKGLALGVYDAIIGLKTDYVVEFSPDNNCIPEQLPNIVEKINEGYDLVVVSRYLPPAKSEDDGLITGFGNWMFSRMIRYLGKFPVTDALTIYRGYRCDIIKKYNFEKYLTHSTFEPLVSAIGNLHNVKYYEIPGDEPKRIGGVSKTAIISSGLYISLMIVRLYIKKFTMLFSKKIS
jgi:glycosyltransferase involved in cell wall biosynthesis